MIVIEMLPTNVFLILISVASLGAKFPERFHPDENVIADESATNAEIRANLYRLAARVVTSESHENVQYNIILESLMQFLKLHQEYGLVTDFTPEQVVELITIFQRFMEHKNQFLIRFLKTLFKLRTSKPIQAIAMKRIINDIACLQEFSTCVNLDVIAKRLSSPKVEVVVDSIEYLLPYAKIYATELDVCISSQAEEVEHVAN